MTSTMQHDIVRDGLFYGLPEDTYARAPGLSHTALRQMLRSPAHFAVERAEGLEPKPCTPAKFFGKLCHHLALTPDAPRFWAVLPEGLDRRTKEGKAFAAAHPGKTMIDHETWGEAQAVVTALRGYRPFAAALSGSRTEVSWFLTLRRNATAVRLKGRVDVVCPGEALCELKFVTDARPRAIGRAVVEFAWHMQAAFYLEGYNRTVAAQALPARKERFVIFAIEKQPPYAANCLVLPPALLHRGQLLCEAAIRRYLDCEHWQQFGPYDALCDYSAQPQMLLLPEAA